MPILPPAIVWMLSAIGAAVAAKVIAREWQRVNEELRREQAEPATVGDVERDRMTRLRRDPVTGVYRPNL